MHNWEKSPIVLIPSLEPDDRLIAYVDQLYTIGLNHVQVIDDGFGLKHQPIFSQPEKLYVICYCSCFVAESSNSGFL